MFSLNMDSKGLKMDSALDSDEEIDLVEEVVTQAPRRMTPGAPPPLMKPLFPELMDLSSDEEEEKDDVKLRVVPDDVEKEVNIETAEVHLIAVDRDCSSISSTGLRQVVAKSASFPFEKFMDGTGSESDGADRELMEPEESTVDHAPTQKEIGWRALVEKFKSTVSIVMAGLPQPRLQARDGMAVGVADSKIDPDVIHLDTLVDNIGGKNDITNPGDELSPFRENDKRAEVENNGSRGAVKTEDALMERAMILPIPGSNDEGMLLKRCESLMDAKKESTDDMGCSPSPSGTREKVEREFDDVLYEPEFNFNLEDKHFLDELATRRKRNNEKPSKTLKLTSLAELENEDSDISDLDNLDLGSTEFFETSDVMFDQDQIETIFENNRLAEADEEVDTPFQMTLSLLPHQKRALAWMMKRERSKVEPFGGILADEMGLGKTLSLIALLLKHPPETEDGKPAPWNTLIVAPASVLNQWKRELEDKISTSFRPKIGLYHGSSKKLMRGRLRKFDVVLTSYGAVQNEAPDAVSRGGPLHTMTWHRIVLDESQLIKNRRTGSAKAACQLIATHRWCLTGTPIENTIDDLWAQFMFLRYEAGCPHGYSQWVRSYKPIEKMRPGPRLDKLIARFQVMLGAVLLRRLKSDKFNGREVLTLPPLTIEVVEDDLRPEERMLYEAIQERNSKIFDALLKRGEVMKNYMHVLVLLLRLRQMCDHTSLIKESAKVEDFKNVLVDVAAGKGYLRALPADVRSALESTLARLADEEVSILNCQRCDECFESDKLVVTRCGHLHCIPCIEECHDSLGRCYVCNRTIGDCDERRLARLRLEFKIAKLVERGELEAHMAEIEDERKIVMSSPSTKLNMLVNDLRKSREMDPTVKTIVFSQWTSMLDLIEVAIRREGFNFVRLDGSMDIGSKSNAISEFQTRSDTTVILVSLRAGGSGVNLTAASRVILFDFWWNPAVEDQAISRAHRMGQKRPVVVRRFKIRNSVEDKMLALQEKKKAICDGALGGKDNKFVGRQRLTLADLKLLFGHPDH